MPVIERRLTWLAIACIALVGVAGEAAAQKAKSTQTEAVWVRFDPEAKIVVAKVKKPGKGAQPPRNLRLRAGEEASWKVEPEGSILTRTSVAIRGQKAQLREIPEGKTVNIYWVADPKDENARFARKIDVILSDEELDEMYPDRE